MERQIGEIFQDGEVTLKVEKEREIHSCEGCYYDLFDCSKNKCTERERSDETSVIFVKQ